MSFTLSCITQANQRHQHGVSVIVEPTHVYTALYIIKTRQQIYKLPNLHRTCCGVWFACFVIDTQPHQHVFWFDTTVMNGHCFPLSGWTLVFVKMVASVEHKRPVPKIVFVWNALLACSNLQIGRSYEY